MSGRIPHPEISGCAQRHADRKPALLLAVNTEQLCKQLLPTNSITAALTFQFSIVPDQPQIRASETKTNPNVTPTLIIGLTLT